MESQEGSVDQYLKRFIQRATAGWAAVAALERRLNVTLEVADQTWDEVVVSWDQIRRSGLVGQRPIDRRRVLSWRLR
jgi:hypothetical protein